MKLKRFFASLIASTFVLSSVAFAADKGGKPFLDVDADTNQGKAIMKMYEKGYLKGYEDGTFKPNGNITRAELTRVFNQVFGYTLNVEETKKIKDFTDNTNSQAWYYNDVRIAQSNGYINGFEDGSFRPKDNFTREQTCTVVYLVAKLKDAENTVVINDKVSAWAKKYVDANIAANVFSLESNNTFRATANITRGEVCEALVKFVKDGTSSDNTVIDATVTENSTEATTASNSDATTETTTKSSSTGSTGGGGGGGGGGSSSTITEPTTENTTISPSDITMNDAQREALAKAIRQTKNEFIPRLYKSEHIAIANVILNALQNYYDDGTYDFTGDIGEAKQMYKALSQEDQAIFRTTAISTYDMSDYEILMPLFSAFI